jgi:hypothetical protein
MSLDLGSAQVGFRSSQFDFSKNGVRSGSDSNGSDGFLRSSNVLPPLVVSRGVNGSCQVIIILLLIFIRFDPIRLNSGQKILIHI